MEHWSVDAREIEKDPKALSAWHLEQAINFGIRDGKINERELRERWDDLDLDPHKKKFLSLLLFGTINRENIRQVW